MRRALLQASASANGVAGTDAAAARRLLESIQTALFDAFRGAPQPRSCALTMDEITPIKALCDQLMPAHFKLEVPEPRGSEDNALPLVRASSDWNRVGYQHIWENELFSIGIFVLPPGASIPLHDHPDMSVVSRVLYGRLHVTSCDIIGSKRPHAMQAHASSPRSSSAQSSARHVAQIFKEEMVTAPHTTELLPDRGNLHEFVADTDVGCAIFDILTPPYDPAEGRDCTYYRIVGTPDESNAEHHLVELEEYEPTKFEVVTLPYLGPTLMDPPHGITRSER